MNAKQIVAVGVVFAWLGGAAAASDNAPVIVIPGKRGVPVMINGRDASWAVVEGDWGLYRPGAAPVTVIYPQRWPALPPRRLYVHRRRHHVISHAVHTTVTTRTEQHAYIPPALRHYFPGGGAKPVRGRLEIEPKEPAKPAKSYFRTWTTESPRIPANVEPPAQIVAAPSIEQRRRRPHRAPNRHANSPFPTTPGQPAAPSPR